MRKKMKPEEKRKHIIGIKVKEETKFKINYIASAEGKQMSTYINELIENHITEYTKKYKIKWEEEWTTEKR